MCLKLGVPARPARGACNEWHSQPTIYLYSDMTSSVDTSTARWYSIDNTTSGSTTFTWTGRII